VNGVAVGEAPVQVRLPAGRHHVRLVRNGRRLVDKVVTVDAGQRKTVLN
jgi:hypothetical protein